MSLPRRVPWSSTAEFEAVFHLLFASDGDLAQQWRGINRIHTWQSRQSCPYAAEATASLLSVILQDASPNVTIPMPAASLRLSYSMALIRFVNGLVDPAQTGPFARSIAGIANQIGLPLWFVELRHAATHEDLPSLPVLRDAARKAMDWLYTRYWLPQIQYTQTDESEGNVITPEQRASLLSLLTAYKTHQKQALRDLSLSQIHEKEFNRLIRSVERWTVHVGSQAAGNRFGSSSSSGAAARGGKAETEETERIGCTALVEGLCEIGCLVPTSKKKRSTGKTVELPTELLAIWEPLLEQLDDSFDTFSDTLIWHMLDLLSPNTAETSAADKSQTEKSYLFTITAWLAHLLQKEESDMQRDVIRFCLVHSNTSTAILLQQVLLPRHPDLVPSVAKLQQIQRSQPALVAPAQDDSIEDALSSMQKRLLEMENRLSSSSSREPGQLTNKERSLVAEGVGKGSSAWRLSDEGSWSPVPFGMLPGGKTCSLDL